MAGCFRGNDGNRRLDDPQDFVRREIALALEQGKKVIPVLFDETLVPARDRLPDPLKALASYDPLTLRGKTHEYQAQRRKLVERLAEVPGVPEPQPEPDEAFAGHEKIARWRKMAMDVQSKIDSMDNANQEELEDVLHVLERHPDYLDFDNAVKSELRDPHKEHGLTPYGRTAYIGTTLNGVVSDVLSRIGLIEKVWINSSIGPGNNRTKINQSLSATQTKYDLAGLRFRIR